MQKHGNKVQYHLFFSSTRVYSNFSQLSLCFWRSSVYLSKFIHQLFFEFLIKQYSQLSNFLNSIWLNLDEIINICFWEFWVNFCHYVTHSYLFFTDLEIIEILGHLHYFIRQISLSSINSLLKFWWCSKDTDRIYCSPFDQKFVLSNSFCSDLWN